MAATNPRALTVDELVERADVDLPRHRAVRVLVAAENAAKPAGAGVSMGVPIRL